MQSLSEDWKSFALNYGQIDFLLVVRYTVYLGKESTEEEFFHTFNSLHSGE